MRARPPRFPSVEKTANLDRNYLIGRVLSLVLSLVSLSSHAFTPPLIEAFSRNCVSFTMRLLTICAPQRFHCNAGPDTVNPSNAYMEGCINGTRIYLQQHAAVMGGAGIAVACLMVRMWFAVFSFYRSFLLEAKS